MKILPLEKEVYDFTSAALAEQRYQSNQNNQNCKNNVNNLRSSDKRSVANPDPSGTTAEQPLRLGTIDIIRYIQNMSTLCDASGVTPKSLSGGQSGGQSGASGGVTEIGGTEIGRTGIERTGKLPLDIHLVLGSDTYADLMTGKWKDAER